MGEEVVILVVILLGLSIPVAVVGLLIWVRSLSKRLALAEATLLGLEAREPTKVRPDATPRPAAAKPASTSDAGPWRKAEAAGAGAPRRSPAPPPELTGPTLVAQGVDWLAANWFYVVAAASLALAGIFLIQYGVERGLLPPPLRVMAAVAFGAVLIAGGEWLRRRWGDGEDVATAYLPSVFSGAGIVTLFAAILGARHLYDLTGPGLTLTGLALVAIGAVVLGWFHGPLLVAVGLVGGAVAPFAIGGSSAEVTLLHGYFGVLALVGLAVDAVRCWPWRWVSWLALLSGFGGTALLAQVSGPDTAHLAAVVVLVLAAFVLPVRRLWPDHPGAMLSETLAGRPGTPTPEVVLAGAAMAVGVALVVMGGGTTFWPAMMALLALFAAVVVWAMDARAVQDTAMLPVLGIFALIAQTEPVSDGDVTWALGVGVLVSCLAFWRSLRDEATFRIAWALGAVVAAPATGLVLHLAWEAPGRMGDYIWALHALAVAGLLTLFAGFWAARDGDARLRPSLAALLGFTVIGYGVGQVAGEAALTVAIAGMAALAAGLDRRFELPLLTWFVVLAAPFCGWRLIGDPGWIWAIEGPLGAVLLSFVGVTAGFAAAWWMLRKRDRIEPEIVADTASLSALGLTFVMLVWRWASAGSNDVASLSLGLTATIWLLLSWVQLTRWRRSERLRWLRLGLAGLFGGIGGLSLLLGATVFSPLNGLFGGAAVMGPPVFNTMMGAYLLPAMVLLAMGIWWVRVAGLAVAALWLTLAIRHFWNGSEGMPLSQGASQPEITSYTVVLLIVGGALFYQGIAARSDLWRRSGVTVLAVTAAKVFLIDAASLAGLLRVGAFVALALSLAGLAWLNRWAGGAPGMAPEPGRSPSDVSR
ncbi:MAG: DUF2339 domain-containing protein [Jannaschia sp.]